VSESFSGTGYILKGLRKVCPSHYRITKSLDSEFDSEDARIREMLCVIDCKIKPLGMPLTHLFGDDFTLTLEDGRKIDFFITETETGKVTPKAGLYR
jgi:hypothetical protein